MSEEADTQPKDVTKDLSDSRKSVPSASAIKRRKLKENAIRRLEHVVLGDDTLIVDRLQQRDALQSRLKESDSGNQSLAYEDGDNEGKTHVRKAAWEDEDDECEYESKVIAVRPTSQLASDTPKWARLDKKQSKKSKSKKRYIQRSDSSEEKSDDDNQIGLSQSTGNYLTTSTSLPSINIQIKKCSNANKENPSHDLSALEFHSKSTVVLTAGSDCRFNLFQIDGEQNRKIHTVFVDRFSIQCGHFSADGLQIILGSGNPYFCYFDLEAAKLVKVPKFQTVDGNKLSKFVVSPDDRYIVFRGQYGYIHLVSSRSKEYLTSLKMNGSVDAVAFSKDGNRMYSFGSDGQVYVWDMNNRCCIHKFYDDGCVNGTSMAVSPNHKYLACGSDSGVVNIYDVDTCMNSNIPRPRKTVMNLTTACTSLLFNHTNEIIATASSHSEKAVKLVHLPSMTVFRDFPDQSDASIRFSTALDISPNSGYLTIGTNKGQALLYRVKHFGSY